MILIPELETVLILVPRTSSGSLYRAVMARYPKAMMIYRHMEADGVPQGYERWLKVGVVRNPIQRLWSLYNYIEIMDYKHGYEYVKNLQNSIEMPFVDWVLNNKTVFTSPHATGGSKFFIPKYTVRHSMPETIKSQYYYLRPDLGTKIFHFNDLSHLQTYLDVRLEHHNKTVEVLDEKILTKEFHEHMKKYFSWDFYIDLKLRSGG